MGAIIKGALALVGLGGISPMFLLAGALAAVAALGGLYLAVDHMGYARAQAECNAAALRAELANKQRDLDAASKAAAEAEQARVEIEAAAQEDRRKVAEYAEALKTRPNSACALSDDDLRFLRNAPRKRAR